MDPPDIVQKYKRVRLYFSKERSEVYQLEFLSVETETTFIDGDGGGFYAKGSGTECKCRHPGQAAPQARPCQQLALPPLLSAELLRSWTLTAVLLLGCSCHRPCVFTFSLKKQSPGQQCLMCPSSVHQDIGRGSVTGDREGLCLPLNLGLSPTAERGWPRSRQNHTVHCGVSHQILKGTVTPPLLPEKIMNYCIRLSLITALELYDSKY